MKVIPTIQSTSSWLRVIRQINALFSPLKFTEQRSKKYGDFYQIVFKNAPPTIVTSNPQAIEDIFTASPSHFEVGRSNKSLSFLVGDNSLLLLDGKKHQSRRRLLMLPFHGESLQECQAKIVVITDKVCSQLEVNRSFNVRSLMQEITMRVILSVVFGIDSGERCDRLRRLLTSLLETFNNPLNSSLIFFPILQQDWGKFSPWGRFCLLQQEIRSLIYAEIKERREVLASQQPEKKDIFTLLLSAKDQNGEGMTDEELHDELITLLFAGHETTASALAWVFYWVHYLPQVQEKIRFELDNWQKQSDDLNLDSFYNGGKSRNRSLDKGLARMCYANRRLSKSRRDLSRNPNDLTYLNATIAETLRIYPIAAATFPRILTQPMSLMGHNFDTNTWIITSIYALHQREDLYPNPKQFNPQRFLERTYSNYEYIPFGGGNRRCIGSALALLEMKLVTATILSNFELELAKNKPMMPVRRGLTIAPPASFKMIVKSKKN